MRLALKYILLVSTICAILLSCINLFAEESGEQNLFESEVPFNQLAPGLQKSIMACRTDGRGYDDCRYFHVYKFNHQTLARFKNKELKIMHLNLATEDLEFYPGSVLVTPDRFSYLNPEGNESVVLDISADASDYVKRGYSKRLYPGYTLVLNRVFGTGAGLAIEIRIHKFNGQSCDAIHIDNIAVTKDLPEGISSLPAKIDSIDCDHVAILGVVDTSSWSR